MCICISGLSLLVCIYLCSRLSCAVCVSVCICVCFPGISPRPPHRRCWMSGAPCCACLTWSCRRPSATWSCSCLPSCPPRSTARASSKWASLNGSVWKQDYTPRAVCLGQSEHKGFIKFQKHPLFIYRTISARRER